MKELDLAQQRLVKRIAAGDEQAFQEAFYQHKDRLFSYCNRFTKSEESAEEIVHDALLKVWSNRRSLDPNRSFISYLYTITRNLALNFLKKQAVDHSLKQRIAQGATASHNGTQEAVYYNNLVCVVERVVQQLPAQQQQVYRMSRHRAMTHEEIARQLNISKHTVRNHMIKALQSIKSYLRLHADITLVLLYYVFCTAF